MADRTVHAELPGVGEIVRYDRAGKWWYEPAVGLRKPIPVHSAAIQARGWLRHGGTVHFDLPGGGTFDRIVRGHA